MRDSDRKISKSPYIRDVTDATFESEVLERSDDVPVVVDFWAPWCGPCKPLGPLLEDLAEETDGAWILAKLDVDENLEVASSYNVRGIPAVKGFVDGEVAGEFTGAKPKNSIERWLETLLPGEVDEKLERAGEALDQGDLDAAEQLFEKVLESERYDTEALVGLARVALGRGDPDRGAEYLEQIPEAMREEAEGAFERTWISVEAARHVRPSSRRRHRCSVP